MGHKPIYLDSVDVSECKYYLRNIHKSCGQGLVDCEGKDCMFKQLARKTQECEDLKSEGFTREELITIQEKDIDCYRNALEEIEKVIKINCEEICGRKFADCNDFLCTSKNIINIINKAKDDKNE